MTRDSNIVPLALQPPNNAIRIRSVRAGDLSSLQADCWSKRSLTHGRDLLRRVLDAEQRKRGMGIVVENEMVDRILAYGQIIQWTKCAEISDLIVSADYRSKGIGTAMIQYLIAKLAGPKPDCVEIGVAQSNPRALALYRRLGFRYSYSVKLDLGQGKEKISYLRLVFADYESVSEHDSDNKDH
jgi:GNAT superfamily N-acetyltransferase